MEQIEHRKDKKKKKKEKERKKGKQRRSHKIAKLTIASTLSVFPLEGQYIRNNKILQIISTGSAYDYCKFYTSLLEKLIILLLQTLFSIIMN